ncbi:hypothetical protein BTS2_2869 [Bacillus sp. TS-2]|nr:hypothetical protein BTS2_2869 [Bacillus sp. TS-2]
MQRYFVDSIIEGKVRISGDDVKHISRVMRMDIDDSIICISQEKGPFLCKITSLSGEEVVAEVMEHIDSNTELPVNVSIAQGLAKGDKLDYVVQKGTELGAYDFYSFTASRSIVKWDQKKAVKKQERLQKIAKEAAEQSYRLKIPEIHPHHSFPELLKKMKSFDAVLVAYEEQSKKQENSQFVNVLKRLKSQQSLLVIIGPEGGFDETEIQALIEHGAITCGLGPRILRTETASQYVLAAISYQTELLR